MPHRACLPMNYKSNICEKERISHSWTDAILLPISCKLNSINFLSDNHQANLTEEAGIKPATKFFLENQLWKNELHAKSCQLQEKNDVLKKFIWWKPDVRFCAEIGMKSVFTSWFPRKFWLKKKKNWQDDKAGCVSTLSLFLPLLQHCFIVVSFTTKLSSFRPPSQ